MFNRRRRGKTDYNQRLGLLKSEKIRAVIRRSLNLIHIQMIKYEKNADRTLFEESSRSLREFGWKGHCGNVTAAYLCGFASGIKVSKLGIKDIIVDIGLRNAVKGSTLFAAALGLKDAGIAVNIGANIVPDADRLSGMHIAEYAKKLKRAGGDAYTKHFSYYLKNGLEPEHIPEHFKEVKAKISAKT